MDDGVFAAYVAAAIGALLLLRWGLICLAERFFGPCRKLARAPLTRASEIVAGQRCRVAGVARRHPNHPPVTARFTDRPALLYEGELRWYDRSSDSGNPYRCRACELQAVELFCVEDESGTVVVRPLVAGTRRTFELQRDRYDEVPMDRVEALLATEGMKPADVEEGFPWGWTKLPSDYHVNELVLQEGQRVVVVGTPRAEVTPDGAAGPGYREAPRQLRLSADGEQPLYVTNRDKVVARLGR